MHCRLLLPALLLVSSCAAMDAHFTVDVSPQLTAQHAFSLFGAMKDGRLDPDYGLAFAPALARAFDGRGCTVLFDDGLRTRDPELYMQLDMQAKGEGVTNELLAGIAPHAAGDVIMVVYASGQLPVRQLDRSLRSQQPQMQGMGGHGRRQGGLRARPVEGTEDNALELSLFLYSPAARDNVAQVTMRYTGQDDHEAQRLFIDKIRALFPDFSCAGWK